MWARIKENATWFALAFLALFGMGAVAAARARKKKLEAANWTNEVITAKAEIGTLKAKRETLAEREADFKEEIAEIDRQLARNKQTIAEVHAEKGLTTEEIAAEFERLGY